MSKKKSFKWVWIIAIVAVVVLIVVLLSSGNKSAAASKSAGVSDSNPSIAAASQQPAVDQDWLELPGAVTDADYEVNTYYDSSVRNYTHLYDKETYTSLWTAYPLNSTYMGSEPRPSKWSYSTSIGTRHQVNLRNRSYNDSYSRGHMIPNASRNGNKAMQMQTFFVTNSVPQIQNSFNSGIWSKLEGDLQDIGSTEEIYIVTGVAFNKVGEDKPVAYTTAKDDTKQVPIPNYFYKVVLRVKMSDGAVTSASTIGFWMDHRKYTDSYTNYTVSVDQIEQWTGFDFFVNLPDTVESAAESNTNWTNFQNF
jgi:endonuclease G